MGRGEKEQLADVIGHRQKGFPAAIPSFDGLPAEFRDGGVEMVPISDISAHPGNWQIHPAQQGDALRQSLDEFGVVQPCTFNRQTGHLLDGHLRLDIAIERGQDALFCRVVDWDAHKEERFLLACDKIGKMAGQDDAKLIALFDTHKNDDFGPPPGWTLDEIESLGPMEKQIDEKPQMETPDAPDTDEVPSRAAFGDVWQAGEHIIVVGDSSKTSTVRQAMAAMRVQKVAQVFTDPPYDGINASTFGGERRPGWDGIEDAGIGHFSPNDWFLPSMRIWFGWSDRGAGPFSLFCFCNDSLLLDYMQWCRQRGGTWATLTCYKTYQVMPVSSHHWPDCEYLLWMKRQAHWNDKEAAPDARRGKALPWDKSDVSDTQRESGHPTPKPLELIANQLLLTTMPLDVIADPFGGSGAVLIACEKLNRRCLYIDRDQKWADAALMWWELMTGHKAELIYSLDATDDTIDRDS